MFEYFNSDSVDFGSIVGLVVLLVWVNGNLVKVVYIYLCLEWMVLVVGKELMVKFIIEFKGKKIVVIKGIDLYFFLLCVLYENGFKKSNVEIVYL